MKKETLRRQCAWCDLILDGKGKIRDGEQVSHGMCATCQEKWSEGFNLKKKARLVRALMKGAIL
jgi:hypothetical protein